MPNPTLLHLSPAAFEAHVTEALDAHREGAVLALAASPLAHSSLVEDCLLAGEAQAPGGRGQVLQAVLRWAVAQLRPKGSRPTPKQWRHYKTLQGFYWEGLRVAEAAAQAEVGENHFYAVRRAALAAVSAVLRAELANPVAKAQRGHFAMEERYWGLTEAAQTLLRAATIFGEPVAVVWLPTLAGVPQALSNELCDGGLLQTSPAAPQGPTPAPPRLIIEASVRVYVAPLLTPHEQTTWHWAAAHLYAGVEDYLAAAQHYHAAQAPKIAAKLLLEHTPAIVAQAGWEPLAQLLPALQAKHFKKQPEVWAKLKLLEGEAVEKLQNLEAATTAYSAALTAGTPLLKAQACYRLAKVFEKAKKIDEALAAYQRGLSLVEKVRGAGPLAVTLHIHRAWVFIQLRPNAAVAQADLQRAAQLLQPQDLANQADLENAWAGFYVYCVADAAQALAHRLQYWLLTQELGDLERQLTAALNLGQDYVYEQRHAEGLKYLAEGLALARRAGNRGMEGRYQKAIGNCYFFQADYPQALQAYAQALALLQPLGDQQWVAHVHHDIAEAYAAQGQWAAGRLAYQAGQTLAEALGGNKIDRHLLALREKYPRLGAAPVAPQDKVGYRHQQIMDLAWEQGSVSNAEVQAHTGVKKAQAARDLKALVTQKLLHKLAPGGAGTRYGVQALKDS